MAVRLMEAKNIRLEGKPGATDILLEGKAIFVCMAHVANVSLNGLGFDYLHQMCIRERVRIIAILNSHNLIFLHDGFPRS